MTINDAIRQEIEAARLKLKRAKCQGNDIEEIRLYGYIAGLQVALKLARDAAKMAY